MKPHIPTHTYRSRELLPRVVTKVLINAEEAVQAWAMIYKAVVQTVLIYGSEIWVVTEDILTVLEGFHHRVARQIVVNTARRSGDGRCEWPPVKKSLEVAGMGTIK